MAGPLALRRRGWSRAAGPSSHTSLLVLALWSRTPTEVGRPPQGQGPHLLSAAPLPPASPAGASLFLLVPGPHGA